MKDLIRRQLGETSSSDFKKLVLSEFLQHLILQSLYRQGSFECLTFTGGTALRILYHTGRYSEDLDFSVSKAKHFSLNHILQKIQKDFGLYQIPLDSFLKEEKTIAKADVRFPSILQEFNLTPLRHQKLTVKIEVDRHPPSGGVQEIALVTHPISYMVSVFDLPSLFATKLHALFFRRYAKGRDYYDLAWYLGRKVKPNFKLLNNAIRQTQGTGHGIKEQGFKQKLSEHLETVDFAKVRSEVERFLINREELKLLDVGPLKSLLRHYE